MYVVIQSGPYGVEADVFEDLEDAKKSLLKRMNEVGRMMDAREGSIETWTESWEGEYARKMLTQSASELPYSTHWDDQRFSLVKANKGE